MSLSDLTKLFGIAQRAGVRKLKITGGEPLLRGDVTEIVRAGATAFDEVSMTTNGVFLASHAQGLKHAGLTRINVSLDALSPQLYESITGSDDLKSVICGVDAALKAGLAPLKINMVLLNEVNVSEVPNLLAFAHSRGVILQLIELNPVNGNGRDELRNYFYSLLDLEDSFASEAIKVERNELHDRNRYAVPFNGSTVEVEVVRCLGRQTFCTNCTRMRVTSNGMLKPCLMTSDGMIDMLSPIRAGASDMELLLLFESAVNNRVPYWVAK